MNIALIADDDKKELLTQFCTAYSGILKKCDLCAPAVTAKLISEGAGLEISPLMPEDQGGIEQLCSLVSCNTIDLLLFFRTTTAQDTEFGARSSLLHLCDIYCVPAATNIATAEVLIHGLNSGWLDWREIVNPKNS